MKLILFDNFTQYRATNSATRESNNHRVYLKTRMCYSFDNNTELIILIKCCHTYFVVWISFC